jgi:hypothetical protein
MGEATYYGKLTFDNIDSAKIAYEPFKALLLEIYSAGEFWQKYRGLEHDEENNGRGWFWQEFEEKFPNASEYLKSIDHYRSDTTNPIWGGDCNNSLAGLLDVLGSPDDTDYVLQENTYILWNSTVWHFSDWDPFIEFCKKTIKGCIKGGWLSDEYVEPDYYNLID